MNEKACDCGSHNNGDYCYPSCTVVDGTIAAGGGGVEHPTITIASSTYELDDAIAHEAGHNWFYGILASNERSPVDGRGMNSFFEQRHLGERYPNRKSTGRARYPLSLAF
ncbi:MAG: hypothetical protein IPL81_14545 [Flavobacteriales bacterium]|nr:hypothetical protein [Flavobacteriales bacterium]